jgi:hypothetical protein
LTFPYLSNKREKKVIQETKCNSRYELSPRRPRRERDAGRASPAPALLWRAGLSGPVSPRITWWARCAAPLRPQPGRPQRYDNPYPCNRTPNLLVFVAPPVKDGVKHHNMCGSPTCVHPPHAPSRRYSEPSFPNQLPPPLLPYPPHPPQAEGAAPPGGAGRYWGKEDMWRRESFGVES